MSKYSLVVAHYRENLDWLLKVPEDYEIYIYDKGNNSIKSSVVDRCASVMKLPNVGMDPNTHLHHIQRGAGRDSTKTIFCQDDPFTHSPDFLSLLEIPEHWSQPQALTYCWKTSEAVPPSFVLEKERSDDLNACRVRREIFSLSTWTPYSFHCAGSIEQGREYLSMHGLPGGWNITGHFLELCGLHELAEAAREAHLGRFAYGAIFATETARLAQIPERAVDRMLLLTQSHGLYPLFLERFWLHFFGETFIKVSS